MYHKICSRSFIPKFLYQRLKQHSGKQSIYKAPPHEGPDEPSDIHSICLANTTAAHFSPASGLRWGIYRYFFKASIAFPLKFTTDAIYILLKYNLKQLCGECLF